MKFLPPVSVDEGGDLVVLHRMASFTWGSWSVTWPEDFEPPQLPPGRDLGFVAKLPTPPAGRFGRRFVRADATIDAVNGWSNVEEILDRAEQRAAGDVFVERDISRAGLGRLVPGVHFGKGDVLHLRTWAGLLPAVVTEIDRITGDGSEVDYRVHVGGQLVSDDLAREAQNSELDRVIAQERRERIEGVGQAQAAAARAESTAGEAKATAAEALEKVDGIESAVKSHSELAAEHAERSRVFSESAAGFSDAAAAASESAAGFSVEAQTAAGAAAESSSAAAGHSAEARQFSEAASKSSAAASGHSATAKRHAGEAGQASAAAKQHSEAAGKASTAASGHSETAKSHSDAAAVASAEAVRVSEQVAASTVAATEASTEAGKHSDLARQFSDAAAESEENTIAQVKLAEAQRALAEDQRARAEAARAVSAAMMAQAEMARALAEEERARAEVARAAAESERAKAEGQRTLAEKARSSAESERSLAETARANAETARDDAETIRSLAEAQRALAEDQRARAEAARAVSAAMMAQAEMARAQAEEQRARAEAARANAESERAKAEGQRTLAENERAAAEAARVEAEKARVAAALARDEAQTARDTAVQASLQRHENQFILHENALKWQRWTRTIMDYCFSTAATNINDSRSDTLTTGLIDFELNTSSGKGVRAIFRPGWSGRYWYEVSFEGSSDQRTIIGRRDGSETKSNDGFASLDRIIRAVRVFIFPDHGVEPREWVLQIGEGGDVQTTLDSNGLKVESFGVRVPVPVVATIDMIAGATLYESGDTIPAGLVITTAYEEADLAILTEVKPTLTWEIGTPTKGKQDLTLAAKTIPQSVWDTLGSWTAPAWDAQAQATIRATIKWNRKNYLASEEYGLRITVNRVEVARLMRGGSLGSINLTFTLQKAVTLQPGDVVDIQAWNTAGVASERRINSGSASITWG